MRRRPRLKKISKTPCQNLHFAGYETHFMKKYPSVPWHKIIGMRNILIHEYDSIDLDRVWMTIQKDIPNLDKEIVNIINSLSNGEPK
jgi:uncharacterized protein with HEPN domain